ncbi:MAG: glutamate--tRNA ligase [Caldilineaceae bacterium]|nr:glutamate--tRNA ligase [Caldilineaceae bacterium]
MSNPATARPVRVRFAPSPTGELHLGGLRTALFDYLWAKHTGGTFILRIEDTDQKRYDPKSLESLMRGLRWLGLEWDEGPDVGGPHAPYIQTERAAIYQQHAQKLLDSGAAYRCYCTAERLDEMREEQRRRKQPTGYDRRCRHLSPAERASQEAAGLPSVIRLAVPLEGKTTFADLIRGDITVENRQLQDEVLLKSDGLPTYHLAAMVDDHLMEISHVLRGEEWLPTAPIHKLVMEAFGWELPVLVHLPVILDPSGKGKMSKRKKVVEGKEFLALVHEFISAGYLPDAMFNFLTNVGWNYDPEIEIFEREEAIARFDVARINPKASALPYEKLDWINSQYIRQLTPAALKEQLIPILSKQLKIAPAKLQNDARLDILVPQIQERIKRLDEAIGWIDWAYKTADEIVYEDPSLLLGRKLDAAQSIAVLEDGAALLQTVEPFLPDDIQAAFRERAAAMGVSAGGYFGPFRAVITGKKVSPPLFESLQALGREEVLRRVARGIEVLGELT